MARKKKSSDPLRDKKEWTISEFQMWLAGAFSLQGEDWVPTSDQWDMIVDIIYKLKDRPTGATRQTVRNETPAAIVHHPAPVLQHLQQDPPVMSDVPVVGDPNPPFTPPEANLPLSELQKLRESGSSVVGSGKAVKTPNIDTSGGYKSGFE